MRGSFENRKNMNYRGFQRGGIPQYSTRSELHWKSFPELRQKAKLSVSMAQMEISHVGTMNT